MGQNQSKGCGTEEAISLSLKQPLKVLNADEIAEIDQALARLGPHDELVLVMREGHLRFIKTVQSKEFGQQ